MDTRCCGYRPLQCRSQRVKYPAWGVRTQVWNSKELTGTRTSGGTCGLIRSNAKNLTRAWHLRNPDESRECSSESLKTGGARLSSARVVRCWVKSRNERNPCCQLKISVHWYFALWQDCQRYVGGRWGRRQIIMPLMLWATHVLQWLRQRAANSRGQANLLNLVSVRIVLCNSSTWSRNR